MTYRRVRPQPDLPRLEEQILERWKQEETFDASIAQREKDPDAREFVFYDGPPFANGLPHYGHLLTGFVKDAVPRYRTMRGDIVHRRFGWDCHGLPAEVTTERELGISGHPEITAFGIDKFNDACRTSVLQYTREWEDYVTRQARWVDFDNDYKTLDLTYDFSTGAAGLLITNGTVGAPVREFTIASTLQRMLLDIVEVGGDLDWLPMRAAGMSLVIRDVTMSGA